MSAPNETDRTSKRGVYAVDPTEPVAPPPGALGAEFRDASGRVIAWCWIAPEHAGPDVYDDAWDWLDKRCPEGVTVRLLKLV